jgi:hypothetical protein
LITSAFIIPRIFVIAIITRFIPGHSYTPLLSK